MAYNIIVGVVVLFGLYQTGASSKKYQIATTTRKHKEVVYKAYFIDMVCLWLILIGLLIYLNYWINLK